MGLFSWLFGTSEETKPEAEDIEEVKEETPKGRQVKYLDIDEAQRKSFLSDVRKLNHLVEEANHIIADCYPKLSVGSRTILNLLEEPKTKTGKDPKCPYTLTFNAHDNPGAIYYFKDMTIAGARFTVWKNSLALSSIQALKMETWKWKE